MPNQKLQKASLNTAFASYGKLREKYWKFLKYDISNKLFQILM